MTDIKNIPDGWELKKLGEVCDIKSGKNQSKVINPNGKYPIYGSSGIFGYADEYICEENTTIIGRKGTINSPLYVTTKFWNVDTAFGLCAKDQLLSKFLYYFCLGFNFKKLDKSTTIPSLAKTDLLAIDIIIPPLQSQQAIVSKIEELFSELDKGIAELKLAQEQLKVYRQSVLKYAFEGKLTNDNVKEGELPKGWEWKKISDLCNVVRGGSPRPAGDSRFYNGNIPFLKVKDITKNSEIYLTSYEHTIKEAGLHKTRKIQPHTLLLSNSGATLGVPKICMIEATINDGIAAFLKLDKRSNSYLYFFWLSKTKELRNIDMGAAQPNLNTDIIKNYSVPYCSFDQQESVVQEIESRLSVADKMEESIAESLQKAEALRQSILKKAFSGELIREAKAVEVPKIKNEYFHQLQLVALVINGFKKQKIDHGEMTLAKNLYLLDSVYKIPTGFKYDRWHLGPYPPALKKVVNNKEYFKRSELFIEATNDDKLLKYTNPYQDEVNVAIGDLSAVFSKYKGAERSHKTELLATVCKVIEDIKSTDLDAVRQSMAEWKIDLKTSKFKNKAEKFNEPETKKCIEFVVERGWDRKLITH